MNGGQTTVVLGGGIGGVVAAVELQKKLPGQHRVVLVDREPEHLFAPSLLWVMNGTRTQAKITRSLYKLERRGIDVVIGEVEQIDPQERTVTVAGSVLSGDHIVVSLGADLRPDDVPGLSSAGHNLYTLEGAESLRRALGDLYAGRLVVITAEPVYKCPAAPYEAAMLLDSQLRRIGARDSIKVDFYAAEPGPMGVAGPEMSAAVRGMVEQKGIDYHPEHRVAEVDAEKRSIRFENGAGAEFDLLAYVPPHRAPRVVHDAGLVNESGWMPVDRHTLETSSPGVYAIGDVTTIPLAIGKPLPKAGTFAHGEARVVAENIASDASTGSSTVRFDGHGSCFIETGGGKAGFGRGDFYGEPAPNVKVYRPGRHWHLGKVAFEKIWFRKWF